MAAMSADRLASGYFRLGTQYYVSARAATIAGLFPVCGNLFHHAIELFLKGDLSATVSAAKLKQGFSHRLPSLWLEFKTNHPDRRVDAFTGAIAALDAFEHIRYPDNILAEGAYGTVSFGPFVPHFHSPTPPPPGYHLVVADLDAIVALIFELSSVNPAFYFGSLGAEAKAALLHNNRTFNSKHCA